MLGTILGQVEQHDDLEMLSDPMSQHQASKSDEVLPQPATLATSKPSSRTGRSALTLGFDELL